MGKGSTGDEREMAKRIGQMSDKDPTITYEGMYVCTMSPCSNMPLHISTARAEIRNKIVPNGINGKYTV